MNRVLQRSYEETFLSASEVGPSDRQRLVCKNVGDYRMPYSKSSSFASFIIKTIIVLVGELFVSDSLGMSQLG